MTPTTCSFCLALGADNVYDVLPIKRSITARCGDIEVTEVRDFDGTWITCDECARLIRSGRREELTDRSFRSLLAFNGEPLGLEDSERQRWEKSMREALRALHDDFYCSRRSPYPTSLARR
jgi:hypothetical protein